MFPGKAGVLRVNIRNYVQVNKTGLNRLVGKWTACSQTDELMNGRTFGRAGGVGRSAVW